MEIGIQKMMAHCKQQKDHMKNRYLRQYEERIKKRRDDVLMRFASTEPKSMAEPSAVAATPVRKGPGLSLTDEASTPTTPPQKHGSGEKRSESSLHHQSHHDHGRSSSSSTEMFCSFFPEYAVDAVQRQKRRRAVHNSQSVILQVEVHNEGVFIMPRILQSDSNIKDDSKQRKYDPEKYHKIIPWGVKARAFLHSVVCGQVPDGFGWDKIPYSGSLQAGLIKCMVTDMRTSEATATAQRAMTMKEQSIARTKSELTGLKVRAQEAKREAADAENQSKAASTERDALVEELKTVSEEQSNSYQMLSMASMAMRVRICCHSLH